MSGLAVSPLEQLVLVSLISWPERARRGAVDTVRLREERLRKRTALRVREVFPRQGAVVSDTDLEAAIDAVLKRAPEVRDWWQALLPVAGVHLEFLDAEPTTPINAVEAWERLLNHLDGDAMIVSALAARRGRNGLEKDVRELSGWGVTIRAGDRSLKALWDRGLSDMHVHAGGVRFAHLGWFDLMDGAAGVEDFKALGEMVPLVIEARRNREALWETIRSPPREECEMVAPESGWWRWTPKRLVGERVLLARCWAYKAASADQALVIALDRYLVAKSRFMAAARQPSETGPGLRLFHQYFRSLERAPRRAITLPPDARVATRGTGHVAADLGLLDGDKSRRARPARPADLPPSPNLAMRNYGDALAYLGECRHLRRLELRAAPAATAADYGRLAWNFSKLVQAFNKDRMAALKDLPASEAKIDVRLAIHFKRTRRTDTGALAPLSKVMRELDRESAALRAASRDEGFRPHIQAAFSRLDVAGWERDTPVALFAPYLRLARGDDAALTDLEHLQADDPRAPEFEHWLQLRERGDHRVSLAETTLGLTVHAGEDFADPLDGLYQVHAAMTAFRMGAGDGIGHGLAMTVDAKAFARERAPYTRIRRGAHLGSLVWLMELVESAQGGAVFAGLVEPIHREVERIAREVYGEVASLDDVAWLERSRLRPRSTEEWSRGDSLRRRLLILDVSDQVRARQDELISLPPLRLEINNKVKWVQKLVIAEAIHRRVVVEMNPASNLRISSAGGLGLSPAVKMLQQIDNGLLASVNTDNPGTFLSRVENEYALLLAGCRQAGVDEGHARHLLEQARRIGLEETWWPSVTS